MDSGKQPRTALKAARVEGRMTQQAVADHLGVGLRHYQRIEDGETIGSIWVWDALEDLFEVHQRTLREIPGNRLGQEASQ